MLKKDYAKLVVRAVGTIESMYYNHLNYEEDNARKSAISALGLSEKDFQKIKEESWK